MLLNLGLFLAIFINFAYGQTVQIYSIEDLKVLSIEKSYEEFFKHAKDVVPSKRDANWKNLVNTMSSDYLNRLMAVEISAKEMETITEISNWNSLKDDEFFVEKFTKVASRYFTQCFKSKGAVCEKNLRAFVKGRKIDKKLRIELSSILYANGIQKNLYSLIKPMAQDTLGEFYCGKPPTSEIILSEIYQNTASTKSIHKDCLKVLLPKIKENLTKGASPLMRYTTYSILKNSKTLTKLDESTYLTAQLISHFNLDANQMLRGYNELKKLSVTPTQREQVLNKLKQMIPLPGLVFKQRTKPAYAIISGLLRYMPEYLDFYATTCLDHLSGKKETAGGNPAVECHEFFELAKLMKIIPTSKINSYDKIMKL